MKFTCNTKPLSEGLDLCIINSNVSKFYKKSCLVQVSISKNTLTVNAEAAFILSEFTVKGSGDLAEGEVGVAFVDSLLFKQLVATLDTPTVDIIINEGGMTLQSGTSKFALPNMVSVDDIEMAKPEVSEADETIEIKKDDWKFIKDYQMYAIAMSYVHPVYTHVWVGNSGDVLVGDFDNSLFTHSKHSNLNNTCLLSDTVINLLNSLPEGSRLVKNGKGYNIYVSNDAFSYISHFTPQYEDTDDVGSYNSSIILNMLDKPSEDSENVAKIPAFTVNKLLNQSSLLSSSLDDTITLSIVPGTLRLQDKNVDGKIPVTGGSEYTLRFKTAMLKQVFSNYTDEHLYICPLIQGDVTVGILIWNKELTTALASIEE